MSSTLIVLASPLVAKAWATPDDVDLQVYVAEFRLLAQASARQQIAFHVVEWRDQDRLREIVQSQSSCVIAPLAAWDYIEHFDEIFEKVFNDAVLGPRVRNATSILNHNGNKRYLLQLRDHGIAIVPSLFVSNSDAAQLFNDGFSHFSGETRLVFKPAIGAGAFKQVSMTRAEFSTPGHVDSLIAAGQAPSGDVIVQPFLETIQTKGEVSLLFFDSQFSHAVLKTPKAGEYRIQHSFGGRHVRYSPTATELALAEKVISVVTSLCGVAPAYARVDFMFSQDGAPLLGEIELFEPYLYIVEGNESSEEAISATADRIVRALTTDSK
jgi:hypothetical protein